MLARPCRALLKHFCSTKNTMDLANAIDVTVHVTLIHRDTLDVEVAAFRTPKETTFAFSFRTTEVKIEGDVKTSDHVSATLDYTMVYENLVTAVTTERQQLLAANQQNPNAPDITNLLQSKFVLSHLDLVTGFLVPGNKISNIVSLEAKISGRGRNKVVKTCVGKIFMSSYNDGLNMAERFALSKCVQSHISRGSDTFAAPDQATYFKKIVYASKGEYKYVAFNDREQTLMEEAFNGMVDPKTKLQIKVKKSTDIATLNNDGAGKGAGAKARRKAERQGIDGATDGKLVTLNKRRRIAAEMIREDVPDDVFVKAMLLGNNYGYNKVTDVAGLRCMVGEFAVQYNGISSKAFEADEEGDPIRTDEFIAWKEDGDHNSPANIAVLADLLGGINGLMAATVKVTNAQQRMKNIARQVQDRTDYRRSRSRSRDRRRDNSRDRDRRSRSRDRDRNSSRDYQREDSRDRGRPRYESRGNNRDGR